MQAIKNDRHTQLCELIDSICQEESEEYPELRDMKSAISLIYKEYKDRINDVKGLILEYQTTEDSIRSRLRKIIRKKRTA